MTTNLGIAAFWLAMGAWFVAMALAPWLRQREIQRTIRVMIERDGKIDAETLKEIRGRTWEAGQWPPPPKNGWERKPGTGRRLLAGGLFIMSAFLAFAVLMALFAVGDAPAIPIDRILLGVGIYVLIVGFGAAICFLIGRSPKPPA